MRDGERSNPSRLTVLCFEECPNASPMIRAAQDAVAMLGPEWELELVDLTTLADTDTRRGFGSPTILHQGRDLFGFDQPSTTTLSCRVYDGGLPSSADIARAAQNFDVQH
ncbi:MAG: hypothetical protein ACI89L_002869 [Phycisphaerales bacterium]|jgi:hypothetical protein